MKSRHTLTLERRSDNGCLGLWIPPALVKRAATRNLALAFVYNPTRDDGCLIADETHYLKPEPWANNEENPMNAETIFRQLVRRLLDAGIFPSPGRIRMEQGRPFRTTHDSGGCNLNGRESRWRAEELEAAGYERVRVSKFDSCGQGDYRWRKPRVVQGLDGLVNEAFGS